MYLSTHSVNTWFLLTHRVLTQYRSGEIEFGLVVKSKTDSRIPASRSISSIHHDLTSNLIRCKRQKSWRWKHLIWLRRGSACCH
ncbi:hypothetical protein OH492_03425 [Vibrio chagasii]|nr:hypothetical protein [Vibrio chagasii]